MAVVFGPVYFSDLQSLTFDILRMFWHCFNHFWPFGGVLVQSRNPRLWLLVYHEVMTSSSHVVYLNGNNFGRSIQSLTTVINSELSPDIAEGVGSCGSKRSKKSD